MSVAHDAALDSAPESRRIAEMWGRLCEHRARLNRLIVQGLPTQVMEDSLRKMEAGLRALQERYGSPGARRAGRPEPEIPLAAARQPAHRKGDAPLSRSPQRPAR
jgi:hypothetical protein